MGMGGDGTTGEDSIDLEQLLISLFKEADKDGNGTLDHDEFATLMATASLGLSQQEVKMLLAEVDEDNNGIITYQEFVPLAVETVQTMRLKARYAEDAEIENEMWRIAAAEIVGPEDAFVAIVKAASNKLASGGVFNRANLKALLKMPALGLSHMQSAAAVAEVPFDASNNVSTATLEASLYDIVLKVVGDALAHQNLGEVGEMLKQCFTQYDKEATGLLDRKVAKAAVLNMFPFVTRLQATALLSDATYDAAGQLDWKSSLPQLTAQIKAMGDPESLRERAELMARAEFQPVELMSHVDRAQFESTIEALFAEADKDGNGVLDVHEFQRLLGDGQGLALPPNEISYLRDAFDGDRNGEISLEEFKALAYDHLAAISRERAIGNALGHG